MKIIQLIAFTLFALTASCFAADQSSEADYPLGLFDFDFARFGADEASHVSAAQAIGFSGMVMRVNNAKDFAKLKRYQAAIGDGPFKLHAGLWTVLFDQDLDAQNAHIDTVIPVLKELNAPLWVVLRVKGGKKVEREQIVDFLRALAGRTKAAGVPLIIYPHWSGTNPMNVSLFESAEEALPYVKEVQNGNVYLSLHLSHELLAGNEDRLDEIAAKIKPWLGLPTINGAYTDSVDFDRGIVPLIEGDYDASKLLKAVKSGGYEGPVILHTWNLHKAAADHHETSFARFQEMKAALVNASQTSKRTSLVALSEAGRRSQSSRITAEAWRATRQDIRGASLESKIEYLLDRAEIEDIITAYSYSVDTRDMSLHGEIFKESFGQNHKVVTKQERQNQVGKFLERFTSTQHLGLPLVIQIECDTAYATASLHARHYDETGEPMSNYLLFGQYEFWFERSPEGWKISKMAQVNRTRIHTSEAELPEEGSPPREFPKP